MHIKRMVLRATADLQEFTISEGHGLSGVMVELCTLACISAVHLLSPQFRVHREVIKRDGSKGNQFAGTSEISKPARCGGREDCCRLVRCLWCLEMPQIMDTH